jgi:hypothetical protein
VLKTFAGPILPASNDFVHVVDLCGHARQPL